LRKYFIWICKVNKSLTLHRKEIAVEKCKLESYSQGHCGNATSTQGGEGQY
jgi:hypothetical protein